MLPPLPRLPAVRELIEREIYFVLHAPRQSGKTTTLRTLAQALTEEGRYAAVLLSVEPGAALPKKVGAAERGGGGDGDDSPVGNACDGCGGGDELGHAVLR